MEGSRRDAQAALLAILIAVAYIAVRHVIYARMPLQDMLGNDLPDYNARWFVRDCWMTLPRLAGFGLALWVGRTHYKARDWGWHAGIRLDPAVVMVMAFAAFLIHDLSRASTTPFDRAQLSLAWLTTLPVAFFEETLFRGVLFTALRRLWSPLPAALASSALFMIWHVEAQPLHGFPWIFFFGVASCAAMNAGLGLPWLILEHEVFDSVIFRFWSGPPSGYFGGIAAALAVVVFLGALALLRPGVEPVTE